MILFNQCGTDQDLVVEVGRSNVVAMRAPFSNRVGQPANHVAENQECFVELAIASKDIKFRAHQLWLPD